MDFIRFESLIGKDNYDYLKNLKIIVIGLGGVGGYTVESLVRCGINNICLIDFDIVDITNKNRQIIATDSTIGEKKIDVFKRRILDINKDCNVEIHDTFLDLNNVNSLLSYNPDFIIDCCDSIPAKEGIIKLCLDNNINFISSCGTGKRIDASKLVVTTLDKTSYDPLARILRKYCKDNRINQKKINVLYSSEEPIKREVDFIPSCSYVPSTGGLLITSYVINKLIGNRIKK